ncbi:unnamed protein product, partial [Pylaiella littoralis]
VPDRDSGSSKGSSGSGKKRPASPAARDTPARKGWSTSVAERLRAPSGSSGNSGSGGFQGNRTGRDEVEAATAMHALATSISSSPPPKKTNENGRGGGGGGGGGVQNKASARSGPPVRRGSEDVGSGLLSGNLLLSPAERAKLRKGNPGSSLLGRGGGGGGGGGDASSSLVSKRGAGAKGKDGPHNTARAIGDNKHQQQKGGGEGGGDGYGGGGKWKREDDREGKEASDCYAERGGGMKPGAMPGEVNRKTPGTPGRRPKKTKAAKEASPAEAAVTEVGVELTSPPAVNPFPNWAEDSDEIVGSRVRVYWDGDNEWYSGRIVRYKSSQLKPYLVRYDEDGSVEWMNLPKEVAIVARQLVWVKMRSHPWWPAQVYQPTGKKAMDEGMIEVKERHAYVVFFKTDESGFVPVGQNVIQSFGSRQDLLNPTKRPGKGLEKAIILAKAERKSMAEASNPVSIESYAKEDLEKPREPTQPPSKKAKHNNDGSSNRVKKGDGATSQKPRKGNGAAAVAAAVAATVAAVAKSIKPAAGDGAGVRPKKEVASSKQPSGASAKQPYGASFRQPSGASSKQPPRANSKQHSMASSKQHSVASSKQHFVASSKQHSVASPKQHSVASSKQHSVTRLNQHSGAISKPLANAAASARVGGSDPVPVSDATGKPSVALNPATGRQDRRPSSVAAREGDKKV